MNPQEYEQQFKEQGLEYEYGEDAPGFIYKPHQHGWTKLVTIAGGFKMRLDDGEWLEQKAGDTCEVQSGQLHEAVVGPDGWKWLAAWRPEEDSTFNVHDS